MTPAFRRLFRRLGRPRPLRRQCLSCASADATAQARVRETFAQFVPAEAKKPEPQVQRKRKIAKSRPAPPMEQSPQMRVAQQSHFGFFGGSNWNSTW